MLLEQVAPFVGEEPLDYCPNWLAIANEVRTRIVASNEDISIPELSFLA